MAWKSKKPVYKKKKVYKKKVDKTATRKEPGDRTALATLTKRIPIFNRASKLMKNMLYYKSQIGMATLTAAPQVFFKANSVYGPEDPGGGHQPIGHSQMMQLYEHFCVIRSNISVTFTNPNTTNHVRVGVLLSPDTLTLEQRKMIENGYVKTTMLTPAVGVKEYSNDIVGL